MRNEPTASLELLVLAVQEHNDANAEGKLVIERRNVSGYMQALVSRIDSPDITPQSITCENYGMAYRVGFRGRGNKFKKASSAIARVAKTLANTRDIKDRSAARKVAEEKEVADHAAEYMRKVEVLRQCGLASTPQAELKLLWAHKADRSFTVRIEFSDGVVVKIPENNLHNAASKAKVIVNAYLAHIA